MTPDLTATQRAAIAAAEAEIFRIIRTLECEHRVIIEGIVVDLGSVQIEAVNEECGE
jgi:hypothetical protein